MINPKNAVKALALTMLAIIVGGCSEDHDKKVVDIAASCGNIHFKSYPKIIVNNYEEPSWNGDTSIDLVVEIPSSEVGAFKQLSSLPEFSPGVQEWWLKAQMEDAKIAGELKDSAQSDFEHADQESPKMRGVVIQTLKRPESRIYISIICY